MFLVAKKKGVWMTKGFDTFFLDITPLICKCEKPNFDCSLSFYSVVVPTALDPSKSLTTYLL